MRPLAVSRVCKTRTRQPSTQAVKINLYQININNLQCSHLLKVSPTRSGYGYTNVESRLCEWLTAHSTLRDLVGVAREGRTPTAHDRSAPRSTATPLARCDHLATLGGGSMTRRQRRDACLVSSACVRAERPPAAPRADS